MIVSTLFRHQNAFHAGSVELKLLPGLPQLHVVGRPDPGLRECGIKLKAALKSLGLKWPPGHMIVVNLRPATFKKFSDGAELAIALGLLAVTEQLSQNLRARLESALVYGEVGLDGRVFAPADIAAAILFAGERPLITGSVKDQIRQGAWEELAKLDQAEPHRQTREFDWDFFWQRPALPELKFSARAAEALRLAVHAGLGVLLAGPPGSGKTTWAKALHALSPRPDPEERLELARLVGESAWDSRWRPLEQPHHTSSALAMVGGGIPLRAGVISRAHGGVLILDELLEFDPRVQEALREPMETGAIELARGAERTRWPCRFQLVATTNLCPCGKMVPGFNQGCGLSLTRCQSVWRRLSGPVVDRFDILVYTDDWLKARHQPVPLSEVQGELRAAAAFVATGHDRSVQLPEDFLAFNLSHRRRRALLRVARALADFEHEKKVKHRHFLEAATWVLDPMDQLRQLFA